MNTYERDDRYVAVSSNVKRKYEYLGDYESNQNKKFKRKIEDEFVQSISDVLYEWFVAHSAKRIPISGPILQEYARKVAVEMGGASGFKVISGEEEAAVNFEIVEDWKARLPKILKSYYLADIYNCDETSLFFKIKPDRFLTIGKHDCKGGKRSKVRYTVLLCTNWAGTDTIKPVAIGQFCV